MSTQKQSWQSEYQKLLRETDEWFTQRQEKSKQGFEKIDRKMQRINAFFRPVLDPILTWVIIPLIETVILLIYLAYSGLLLMSPQDRLALLHMQPSDPTLPVFREVVVFCSFSLLAYCLLTTLKDLFEVRYTTPLSMVPCGYVFCWLMAIGAGIAVRGGMGTTLTIGVSWGIIVIFPFCVFENVSRKRSQKELDAYSVEFMEKLDTIKDLPDDPSALEEDTEGKCTICLKESIYEVCLACETRFRGERQRVRAQILRAKQHEVPATLTLKEWLDTLENFHWRCAYCHGKYEVMEHYIPVTQGGGTTAENCVPGCYKCNSKKSDSHPEQVRKPKMRNK
jgi:5-methylcytosine-specific restriction endonuclease McrA